ncbi:MAG: lipid-A-disaccharide synthase [Deltaproteobacteria bacterium]|nr:lipid-A-disaccharide synthase [Deltaproteobacteria bacterium]
MTQGRDTLFIVCGEPSGETYAAGVARAFRKRVPGAVLEGVGSRRLAAEGVRLHLDYERISVVGLFEVAFHLPAILGALRNTARRATAPDVGAVLLVDFPDFNFRVGKRAAARGVPVVYFIPPQLWAWRKGRARELASFTKGVVVPFPFEEPILREAGVDVRFAGHPLLTELAPVLDAAPEPGRFGIPEGGPVVGLLPGSRDGEIRTHFPLMVRAAETLAQRLPGVRFIVPLADRRFRPLIDGGLRGSPVCATIVEEDRHRAFLLMDAALCASGTATLELSLLGIPPVIVYRTSFPTYWIGKRLVSVRSIGLPNIVAGEPFLPELIQGECRPDRMADELAALLSDAGRRETVRGKCLALRARLRGEGPYEAAAEMLERVWRGA